MYVKAFDDGTIPETETLPLTHLPDRVRWPTVTVDPAKLNQLPTARPANTRLKSKAKGASTNQKNFFNVQWTLRGGGGLGVDVKNFFNSYLFNNIDITTILTLNYANKNWYIKL